MNDRIVLACPECGRNFIVRNPEGMIHIFNLPIIDCKCGIMLEYSQINKKLEKVV